MAKRVVSEASARDRRLEMGQGGSMSQGSNAGVEVPVSNTPLGVDDARAVTFGMQGNGSNAPC